MSLTENNPIDADWISPRERACETVYYLYANIKKKLEIESGKDFIKKNQTLIGQLVQSAIQEFSRSQTAIQQSDK
ncbi:hypothetical protein [Paraprevotella clara]|jgi:hypothetical protein|uniref:hypothetical protein n=1 Tax=Paraprevotella clara TaxID=454154 RepID=UPI0040276F4A